MSLILPLLKDRSFFVKLAVLVLLLLVSTVVTMVLGLVFAIPFTGFDIILNFDQLNDLSDPKSINLLKYFQIVNQIGTFILPVLVFAWLETRNIGSSLLLNTKVDLKVLLISVVLIFTSIPFINTLVAWNEQMVFPASFKWVENWMKDSEEQVRQLTEAFLNTATLGGLIVNLVMIALLAAVGEEFLFRGVLLKLLFQGTKNIHVAVWLSAFIFSAFHMQFYGFVPRMVLGLLFGYVFVWSGSLWLPIILHFIFNGISVVAAYLYQLGYSDVDVDSLGSTQNSLVIIVSVVISIGLVILLYNLKTKKIIFVHSDIDRQ